MILPVYSPLREVFKRNTFADSLSLSIKRAIISYRKNFAGHAYCGLLGFAKFYCYISDNSLRGSSPTSLYGGVCEGQC